MRSQTGGTCGRVCTHGIPNPQGHELVLLSKHYTKRSPAAVSFYYLICTCMVTVTKIKKNKDDADVDANPIECQHPFQQCRWEIPLVYID